MEVFQWGPAQQQAFEELKLYLIQLITLTPPSRGVPLSSYVSASQFTASPALVQEKTKDRIKKQTPIYFVSEERGPSKKNYSKIEKVLYAVLMACRKLRHYFQSHNIIVPSSQPLKDIIRIDKLLVESENELLNSMNFSLILFIDHLSNLSH